MLLCIELLSGNEFMAFKCNIVGNGVSVCGVTAIYVEKRAFYETVSCTALLNRLVFNKR